MNDFAYNDWRRFSMYKRKLFFIIAVVTTALLCNALSGQAASIKDRMLARIPATSTGCEKYGSPDARSCEPCAFIEKT